MKIQVYGIILGLLCLSQSINGAFAEPGEFVPFSSRLSLRAVENQTTYSSFKIYYANSDSLALLVPKTVFLLQPDELFLQENEVLCLQCVQGSFLPIYIKNEGKVSGQAPEGYFGPFYLSMWLEYPLVAEDRKTYVRYVIKNGCHGEVGVRVNAQGECQIIALSNIQLVP